VHEQLLANAAAQCPEKHSENVSETQQTVKLTISMGTHTLNLVSKQIFKKWKFNFERNG
jgi:hypothetical protein